MTYSILVPIPRADFDPTEVAVPWRVLTEAGVAVRFATLDGTAGTADPRMVTGNGLGPLKLVLRADARGRDAYARLLDDPHFNEPLTYEQMKASDFDGLHLPGGHASGMKEYLESVEVHRVIAKFFVHEKPVGAICHGVVAACRSRTGNGASVLHGRRTTALPEVMELSAWRLTRPWLGDYYRTYPMTVQAEVTASLASPGDFLAGPRSLLRDAPQHLGRGFVVRDGNYISARWPGDAHRYTNELLAVLNS
ncbi:MAG: DJ-1/PfpI family protein [Acidobacteria bacterium]|uniref:DJ-1/PfpI family protein n=1 Tax=Candidatus Sulfomarinibacter kjeldsenii TaxID=2885994 RepID=A0A8J6Y5S5_9BACT|nr:DJ-1/PfpI family protein [Candidatus Sulfomarinibacter kjeldsenii]MBD3870084.1 DJ-1/PfpI family protein [Candidatus Sulfomarinibacter kjeldsenii]